MKLNWTEVVSDYFEATGYGNREYVIYDEGTQWIAEIDGRVVEYDRPVDELMEMCQTFNDEKECG